MPKPKKRRYGDTRSTLSKEEKWQIVNDYIAATDAEEVDMNDVARWAKAQGRMPEPKPYDPVKQFAHELSVAAREEYYIDPQGREVRKNHVYVVVDPDGRRASAGLASRRQSPNRCTSRYRDDGAKLSATFSNSTSTANPTTRTTSTARQSR